MPPWKAAGNGAEWWNEINRGEFPLPASDKKNGFSRNREQNDFG
jgi:hypothetical protein